MRNMFRVTILYKYHASIQSTWRTSKTINDSALFWEIIIKPKIYNQIYPVSKLMSSKMSTLKLRMITKNITFFFERGAGVNPLTYGRFYRLFFYFFILLYFVSMGVPGGPKNLQFFLMVFKNYFNLGLWQPFFWLIRLFLFYFILFVCGFQGVQVFYRYLKIISTRVCENLVFY